METETKNETEQKTEPTLLEKSEQLAKQITEANKKAEELLAKNEQILSRITLSGRAEAGTPAPVVDPVKDKFDKEVKTILSRVGR